jgi:hypothetical protein
VLRIRRSAVGHQQPRVISTCVIQSNTGCLAEKDQESARLNPGARRDGVGSGACVADVVQHPSTQVYGLAAEAKQLNEFVLVIGGSIAIPVNIQGRGQELIQNDDLRLRASGRGEYGQ